MNRCPRLDRSFPYKTPEWSVDVRNGQYRASRMSGDEHDLRRGKEGSGIDQGQPPGPSVTVTRLTQVGVIARLGNDRRMTLMDPGRAGLASPGELYSGGKGPPRSCSTESCSGGV